MTVAKSVQDRLKECVNIRMQLRDLGLDNDTDLKQLHQKMVLFVRDETPSSGKIKIKSLGRNLLYTLSTKKDSFAILLKDEHR
jgi:hypothetical protein